MKFEDDMSNPVEVMINQTQEFGKAIRAGLVTINMVTTVIPLIAVGVIQTYIVTS